jgi:hypothetical protein
MARWCVSLPSAHTYEPSCLSSEVVATRMLLMEPSTTLAGSTCMMPLARSSTRGWPFLFHMIVVPAGTSLHVMLQGWPSRTKASPAYFTLSPTNRGQQHLRQRSGGKVGGAPRPGGATLATSGDPEADSSSTYCFLAPRRSTFLPP